MDIRIMKNKRQPKTRIVECPSNTKEIKSQAYAIPKDLKYCLVCNFYIFFLKDNSLRCWFFTIHI